MDAMRVAHWFVAAVGTLGLFSLAACSGGGASITFLDAATVRDLTGSQAPVETPADQMARTPGILDRADSLVVSTEFGWTSDENYPAFEVWTDCTGTQCSWTNRATGMSRTGSLSDLGTLEGDPRAVLTKSGITLMEGRTGDTEIGGVRYEDFRTYGASMDHATFATHILRYKLEDTSVALHRGIVSGELTGVRPEPDITATWRGLLVGTPHAGALRGNVLQGDAALTYTLDGTGGLLDAAFTNIMNLDRGTTHSVSSLRFEKVPVSADGTYKKGWAGYRIQGGFYGPDHVEAAGIVEHSGVVGAFGAKRQ